MTHTKFIQGVQEEYKQEAELCPVDNNNFSKSDFRNTPFENHPLTRITSASDKVQFDGSKTPELQGNEE